MKNKINMDILKAVSVLSVYNWYKITAVNVSYSPKNFETFSTGLLPEFDGEIIKAGRQFATPIYIDGVESVTAEAENRFLFRLTNGGSYTVEGLHKDFADPDEGGGSMEHPETLIDRNRSGADDNGNVIIVLDLRRLGWLTLAQEAQIKTFLNVQCKAQANKYQTPRTVYFKVCADGKIYVGAWDYATEKPMTERKYFDTWMTAAEDAELNKEVETLRKLAESITAAQ